MSKKSSSGIGKHSTGGKVQMSLEDQWRLAKAEKNLKNENKMIPSYIKDGMTQEEMQSAIISHMREGNESEQIGGVSLSISDVDGRFASAKDSRFEPLIRGLNDTKFEKTGYQSGKPRDILEQRVESLASGYSTKDLRTFVTDELGREVYKGGRKSYIEHITYVLNRKFTSYDSSTVVRTTLSSPTTRIQRAAQGVKQAIDRRDIYQERIDAIRAKYKK